MSEDSSAEAPTPKKSPSRKRSSGPRKKARKKTDETPQTAGEAQQAPTSDTSPPANAEPAASQEATGEAPSKASGGNSEDKARSRGGRNRRGRQRGGSGEGRPPQQQQQVSQPRHDKPIDVKKLGKKAWHIYSTEVCEEGLRYIDETDANKLVRRSFRMAEIFLRYEQEQAETVNSPPPRPSRPARSEETQQSKAAENQEETPVEEVEAPAEKVDTQPANDAAPASEPEAVAPEKKADDNEVIEPQTIDTD